MTAPVNYRGTVVVEEGQVLMLCGRIVPQCWGRVHDPDGECICETFTEHDLGPGWILETVRQGRPTRFGGHASTVHRKRWGERWVRVPDDEEDIMTRSGHVILDRMIRDLKREKSSPEPRKASPFVFTGEVTS